MLDNYIIIHGIKIVTIKTIIIEVEVKICFNSQIKSP